MSKAKSSIARGNAILNAIAKKPWVFAEENAELKKTLQHIVDCYKMRSELYFSDAECLTSIIGYVKKAIGHNEKNHVCSESKICSCSIRDLGPIEECPVHGAGKWPPRCEKCGRFLKRDGIIRWVSVKEKLPIHGERIIAKSPRGQWVETWDSDEPLSFMTYWKPFSTESYQQFLFERFGYRQT